MHLIVAVAKIYGLIREGGLSRVATKRGTTVFALASNLGWYHSYPKVRSLSEFR